MTAEPEADVESQKAPQKLNALEEARKTGDDTGPWFLEDLFYLVFSHIPGLRSLLGLTKTTLNLESRNLYFNTPIPEDELDGKTGQPKAKYATNKVRTTKYTPLNFLPKNILFQFENVANIYFLLVAILSGFSIFGVNNAGLASVPIIAIVVITAIRDGVEDWRRQNLDIELNNTLTVVLSNVENENSPPSNVGAWRRFKKACSRFYRNTWRSMRRKQVSSEVGTTDKDENFSMTTASLDRIGRAGLGLDGSEGKPIFVRQYWKDVRVGDIVKVYADQGVPADMLILSSSDPEGDCFIDTRNLDGETSLKARRALTSTKDLRRAWQLAEAKFSVRVEGANADLSSFGWTFKDFSSPLEHSEAIGSGNFLPRGSTVRNSRWVIGYVVYTGVESKIVLNAGATPSKRSRLSRDLNFYVACSFIFLFAMCFVSGVVEGVKFRNKRNTAYFFEDGLMTKDAALNGFVTFFAAMLVLQNMVPISLYISIEIARTCLAFFIYSDYHMYDEETDYPCTPKSWALSDDLGQIEFIFSDKTGTLTQNSMVFRKCVVNGKAYGTAFTESMAGQVKRRGGDVEAIRAHMNAVITEEQQRMWDRLDAIYKNPYVSSIDALVSEPIVADLQEASGPYQHQAIEQFALALALCNTVVTDIQDTPPEGELEPEGDSPEARQIAERQRKEQNRRSATSIAASQMAAAMGDTSLQAQVDQDGANSNIFDLAPPSRVYTNDGEAANPRPSMEMSRVQTVGTRPSMDTRRSIDTRRSADGRRSMDVRRIRSAGVYGGAGRRSMSSARPKHNLDYRQMEGKTLVHKAESPDESALVTMARDLGYTLVEDGKHHKVIDMQGSFHRFETLHTVMFTSQRKRMSVLVKNEAKRYFLLTKGADSMIETLLTDESRESDVFKRTADELERFGDEGLRTLMVAYRELKADYAENWTARYAEALASPDREELTEVLADEIERELTLLGGTGIEDQLQEDVPDTIETLGKAGIKLWMLTGDKVETAISIGFSCNLLDSSMELLIVKHPDELAERLSEMGLEVTKKTLAEAGADHRPAHGKHALIIDGSVLSVLVKNKDYRLQFALLGKKCKAVLCCRVSPSQKAAVVQIMKSTFDVTTLAIGDGANDVSMIQEADIGVGIVGVEGRQAAMSADFAIGQFRFLQRLVLVHGRWSYLRVVAMINTLLFENFMFSVTLFWYGIFNQFDESYLYDYTYLTLFNSIFVSVPVVVRGIFDQDLPDYMLLKNPQLYGPGILRKAWTKPIYFSVVADGLYQSAVAFFFAYSIFFNGRFYTRSGHDIAYRQGIGTLVCATAVFACNSYVLLGQARWDWLTLVVYIVSCGLVFAWTGIYTSFIASNFFFRSAEIVYDTASFWAYFFVSLAIAFAPRFVYTAVQRIWFPTDTDIIREQLHYGKKHGSEDDAEAADNEKIVGDESQGPEADESQGTTSGGGQKIMNEDERALHTPTPPAA